MAFDHFILSTSNRIFETNGHQLSLKSCIGTSKAPFTSKRRLRFSSDMRFDIDMKTEGTISLATRSTPDMILEETTPRRATPTATNEAPNVVFEEAMLEKTA
ncbi:7150_t:CDS:2 [Cetraspora pellucida]|uniref:7150_t:CDS:1 n=1 Tax=Cetraspora pellucida TaxID=1433469 RepID=A0A9N9FFJ4_9GLOM|nr:7150_t:CDS:2 [Cetraspora pellucida]